MKNKLRYATVIFCITSILTAFITESCNTVHEPKKKEAFYRASLGNYADLFLRGTYDILLMIRVRELGKIGQAAKTAAQRILDGGKIISQIGTPHIMYAGACAEDQPGNPNIAPDFRRANSVNRISELGKEDFLIIANPKKSIEEARNRGCFVLGIGFPMTTNRYSPPDFNDHPDYLIEPITDLFIYTWGPKEDGIITPALTPNLKILPTSPMTVVAYWLIMSQIAHNLANKDLSGSFLAAQTYMDTLMGRLDVFHERHLKEINYAGDIIAKKVIKGGKMYPWSPREEFFIEANGTAGGLMGVYPLKPDELTEKDVVILAAADSTPVKEIEMARKIKEKGAWLVGIFPFTREDGISTKPLKELCDLSLDNLSGDLYGILDIPGYPNKIIPTTTMMNNWAYWALTGAYVQAMESRGVAPYYWMSFHVDGGIGKAYDDSIRSYFLERGY